MKRLLFLLACGLFVVTPFPTASAACDHAASCRPSVRIAPRRVVRIPIRLIRSLRRRDCRCETCGHFDPLPRARLPYGDSDSDCAAGVCLPR